MREIFNIPFRMKIKMFVISKILAILLFYEHNVMCNVKKPITIGTPIVRNLSKFFKASGLYCKQLGKRGINEKRV